MLSIKNLKASIEDGTQILKGINLEVKPGEVHAIMGPNGSGKSTLSKVIMGHPAYKVDEGSVELDGKNLLEMEISERANSGLFISTQYPTEIPGVNNVEFLKMALNSKRWRSTASAPTSGSLKSATKNSRNSAKKRCSCSKWTNATATAA